MYFLYLSFLSIDFPKVACLNDIVPSYPLDENKQLLRKDAAQSHTQHTCINNRITRHDTEKFKEEQNSRHKS